MLTNSTDKNKKKFLVFKEEGKKLYGANNKYLVVNIDEPYAEEIFEIIKQNEKNKGTWDSPDTFKEFVESI